MTDVRTGTWVDVCPLDLLVPERGVAALVEGRQVAVFLLEEGDLHAVDNRDPFSGAMVLSRGIVGSVGPVTTVASPVYKQRFDLETGVCVDDATVRIATHEVRVFDGVVQVLAP